MMTANPWKCNDAAFDVMFSDDAEFKTSSTHERGTIRCCVFPREDVDPFAESDNESLIKLVNVLVKKCDWYFTVQPQVGDQIVMPSGDRYKVSEINDEQNWYRLTGRSVG